MSVERFKHYVTEDGEIRIEGDAESLRLFANQILNLTARPYVDGSHAHFDEAAYSDPGSASLVVIRVGS